MNENPLNPISRKTRLAAGKVLLVFLVLMAILTMASNTLQEMSIAVVSVVNPQRGALTKEINGETTLEAGETVPVFSDDAVLVAEVYVKAGTSVNEGDPLFRLDIEELTEQYETDLAALTKAKKSRDQSYIDYLKNKKDAVDSAKETLATAQQDFDWAEADSSSWELKNLANVEEDVYEAKAAYDAAIETGDEEAIEEAKEDYDAEKLKLEKLTSMRTYRTKRDNLEVAKKDLSAAQKEYREMLKMADTSDVDVIDTMKSIRLDLENQDIDISDKEQSLAELEEKIAKEGIIRATVSGDVVSVSVEAGAMAQTSSAAVTLSRKTGGLSLSVTVSEDDAGEMVVGESANITVSGTVYMAPIVSISPSTTSSGMYDIGFELPGEAGIVGMKATMKYQKRTENYDLLIPVGALRQDNDGYYVYVISQEDGALGARVKAVRADVYIYDQDSTRVAVQSGISMRDQVISRGDRDINDGDRVRLDN